MTVEEPAGTPRSSSAQRGRRTPRSRGRAAAAGSRSRLPSTGPNDEEEQAATRHGEREEPESSEQELAAVRVVRDRGDDRLDTLAILVLRRANGLGAPTRPR